MGGHGLIGRRGGLEMVIEIESSVLCQKLDYNVPVSYKLSLERKRRIFCSFCLRKGRGDFVLAKGELLSALNF